MRGFVLLLIVALPLQSGSLWAQDRSRQVGPSELAADGPTLSRNQVALDGSHLIVFSLSYVRRVRDTNLGIGGGIGYGWELNTHTFGDRNVWEALHIEVFARYEVSQALQIDAGPTLMGYTYCDGSCPGTFVGLHLAATAGYRFVFIGATARFGAASDDAHGSDFGVIVTPHMRVVIPWG